MRGAESYVAVDAIGARMIEQRATVDMLDHPRSHLLEIAGEIELGDGAAGTAAGHSSLSGLEILYPKTARSGASALLAGRGRARAAARTLRVLFAGILLIHWARGSGVARRPP